MYQSTGSGSRGVNWNLLIDQPWNFAWGEGSPSAEQGEMQADAQAGVGAS